MTRRAASGALPADIGITAINASPLSHQSGSVTASTGPTSASAGEVFPRSDAGMPVGLSNSPAQPLAASPNMPAVPACMTASQGTAGCPAGGITSIFRRNLPAAAAAACSGASAGEPSSAAQPSTTTAAAAAASSARKDSKPRVAGTPGLGNVTASQGSAAVPSVLVGPPGVSPSAGTPAASVGTVYSARCADYIPTPVTPDIERWLHVSGALFIMYNLQQHMHPS